MTVGEDPRENQFLLIVRHVGGSRQGGDVMVSGDSDGGPLPRPDTQVFIQTTAGAYPLTATVAQAGNGPGDLVHVYLRDVAISRLRPGCVLSTDRRRLGADLGDGSSKLHAARPRHPQRRAAPIPFTWGVVRGVDVELFIQLEHDPSAELAASLEGVVRGWDRDGDAFGGGGLHGLYVNATLGPRWDGPTLRWFEDFGSADPNLAADELARRLGEWSLATGTKITRLQFGESASP